MMDVRSKIEAGFYNSKLPYPSRPKGPNRVSERTANGYRRLADEVEAYEAALDEYRAAAALHRNDDARLVEQFRADLIEELGLTEHPKANLLYAKAWEMGHSCGLSEVVNYAEDLVELVL